MKTKTFFGFSCSISGKHIKFWTFWNKRSPSYLLYFGKYRLSQTWLDHSLKNTVSEHPLTVNMLKGPKQFQNLHKSTFITFSITLREPALEYTSLSDILNLRLAWSHIDCQWQVSFSRIREFVDHKSNAVFLKIKIFSDFFVPFLETTLDF